MPITDTLPSWEAWTRGARATGKKGSGKERADRKETERREAGVEGLSSVTQGADTPGQGVRVGSPPHGGCPEGGPTAL